MQKYSAISSSLSLYVTARATDVGSTLHYYHSQVYILTFIKILAYPALFFDRRPPIARTWRARARARALFVNANGYCSRERLVVDKEFARSRNCHAIMNYSHDVIEQRGRGKNWPKEILHRRNWTSQICRNFPKAGENRTSRRVKPPYRLADPNVSVLKREIRQSLLCMTVFYSPCKERRRNLTFYLKRNTRIRKLIQSFFFFHWLMPLFRRTTRFTESRAA